MRGEHATAWLAFGVAISVLAAAPAGAASDAHGGGSGGFYWQVANLVLLLAVLVAVARKPIQKFFASRRETIRSDLDGAAAVLAEAEARFEEWQAKLRDLDAELDEVRANARHRAQEERAHILADARAAADRIRDDATAAVEQSLRQARTELRQEAADLAIELAANLLREKVGKRDRDRLVDEFIARVEEGGA